MKSFQGSISTGADPGPLGQIDRVSNKSRFVGLNEPFRAKIRLALSLTDHFGLEFKNALSKLRPTTDLARNQVLLAMRVSAGVDS